MRFTMRDGSSTLGYGVVSELCPNVDIEALELDRKKMKKALKAQKES